MALKLKLITALLVLTGMFFLAPAQTLAATNCQNPQTVQDKDACNCKNTATDASLNKCVSNNQIVKDLQKIVDALTAGVAIVIVMMIIVGGIQYMAAGDSADGVAKAKKRITNALIALAAFLFIAAFVQWLIPGGAFG